MPERFAGFDLVFLQDESPLFRHQSQSAAGAKTLRYLHQFRFGRLRHTPPATNRNLFRMV
jgi:hypothetical protein